MGNLHRCLAALLLVTAIASPRAHAQARFDLPGPKIDIRVTRAGTLLPIAAVPNLLPGDQLWLHPDLPATQSVHYLLVVAFLRGTTNPPPDNWFIRVECWDKKVREEGVNVTVPDEAQQAILFLAPETSGDFGTLRSAVKGRPGVFVRASQDLNEAGFEQGRIEKYLAAMKQVPSGDPKALQEHSDLLARTLNLKPNPECFKRPLDQQYNCLTQTGTQTLLDDGHAQSVAAALSNGPGSDFINQASYTQLAGAGVYSAYVGAIVDLVRLTSGLHTAKYQYIPAIAFPATQEVADVAHPSNYDPARTTPASLDLRLNTPPSFHDPKSVIVIGLPAVQKTLPPPLRPVDASHISCLLDPHLALPIEGAPLVFSTAFARDLVLHLNVPGGKDIPLTPDAYQGGLVIQANTSERHELPPVTVPDPATAKPADSGPARKASTPAPPITPGSPITGTIQGFWGFDRFTGPTVALQPLPGVGWRIVPSPSAANTQPDTLIVGQPNHLQLVSSGTACVQAISVEPADTRVDWKLAGPDPPKPSITAAALTSPPPPQPVDLTLNLPHDTAPGSIHLAVHQFGDKEPDLVAATAFVEPARIEALQLHAGDNSVLLTGASLDQVKSLTLKDFTYTPQTDTSPGAPSQAAPSFEVGSSATVSDGKTLDLTLPPNARTPSFKPNEKLTAEVHLHDGRTLRVGTVVLPPRPAVSILSRHVSNPPPSSIALAKPDDLPLGSQLTFFLKSPSPFPRTEQIEIANQPDTSDPTESQASPDSLHTSLSVLSGSLVLQDNHTVLATFDPLKTFGPSTFGPFHLRPIAADGTAGEWVPLATIVRLPTFTALTCPIDPTAPCTLTGSSLYLVDSISLDPEFTNPTKVPEGFVDTSLTIPHPPAAIQPATLYVRLRDDPTAAQQVTLSVQTDTPVPPPPRGHGARAAAAAAAAAAPPPLAIPVTPTSAPLIAPAPQRASAPVPPNRL
jgi:hypothetical protein